MDSSKGFSGNTFKIIIDIILLILGIIMIVAPNATMQVITIILGIILIGYGAISIIISISRGTHIGLLVPIICVVLGVILLVFSNIFANTVLPFVIGVWMVVMGIMNLSIARKSNLSVVNTVLSAAAIVLGIIILIGVFVGHQTFGVMLGIAMLIYGIVEIVNWITMGRDVRPF